MTVRDLYVMHAWSRVRSGNASISIQLLSSQPPVVLSKQDVGIAYALLDVFYCIVFLLFSLAVKNAQISDITRVDEEVDSESDYTVCRVGWPRVEFVCDYPVALVVVVRVMGVVFACEC
jgi:hypothetical protein